MPRRPKTNADYSAQTQRKLMTAARREFARVGYADAATERIVKAAGLTRGALYHHYGGKQELFAAVFEQLEQEIASRIKVSASGTTDAFAALVAGCEAWLDACLEAEVQRIVLLDAPAVLGWTRWREVDSQYSMGLLREGIDACIDEDVLTQVDASALTHLLSGAMNEAALLLAQSPEAPKLRRTVGRTLRTLLEGLRRAPERGTVLVGRQFE